MPIIKRQVLKDTTLRGLKSRPAGEPGKRYTLWDVDPRGFGVRVNVKRAPECGGAGNGKLEAELSFIVMRRFRGKVLRITLRGADDQVLRYPETSLADAREAARAVVAQMREGINPLEDRRTRRQAEALERHALAQRQRQTFGKIVDDFLDQYMLGKRSYPGVKGLLMPMKDKWGDLPAADLKDSDFIEYLGPYRRAGQASSHNRRLSALKTMFRWAMSAEAGRRVPDSPVKELVLMKETGREHTLSDEEIKSLWLAADKAGYPGGQLAKMLLLTGCRLREIAHGRWDEIQDGIWEIPGSRTKTGKPHVVPLSEVAQQVLETIPRLGVHVFASRRIHGVPIEGFSHHKKPLDDAAQIRPWHLHDLRRTARTNWSKLRIDRDIRERLLGHVLGGVEGVYDRHDFLEEKREALAAWANRLTEIVRGEPGGNVVKMPQRA